MSRIEKVFEVGRSFYYYPLSYKPVYDESIGKKGVLTQESTSEYDPKIQLQGDIHMMNISITYMDLLPECSRLWRWFYIVLWKLGLACFVRRVVFGGWERYIFVPSARDDAWKDRNSGWNQYHHSIPGMICKVKRWLTPGTYLVVFFRVKNSDGSSASVEYKVDSNDLIAYRIWSAWWYRLMYRFGWLPKAVSNELEITQIIQADLVKVNQTYCYKHGETCNFDNSYIGKPFRVIDTTALEQLGNTPDATVLVQFLDESNNKYVRLDQIGDMVR